MDNETYRKARIRAAEGDTSVSALVKGFLQTLCDGESEYDRLKRLEQDTLASIRAFRAGDRLSREELYRQRGR